MAVKYLSGNRIWGTDAERLAMTTTSSPPQTSWKELGRYTLTGEADTINVGSGTQEGTDGLGTGNFTAKDNLMILTHLLSTGDVQARLQCNGDDADNYASRWSYDGASDTTSDVDADSMYYGHYTNPDSEFIVTTIRNNELNEKLCITKNVFYQSSILHQDETVSKWANTANQIINVQVPNIQSGGFLSGSEVVVLGCDDNEADSGTNFWQEQGTTSGDGTSSTMSATTNSKKYLMYGMCKVPSVGNTAADMRFNGVSSSTYKTRYRDNGGSLGSTSTTRLNIDNGGQTGAGNTSYSFGYIINVSGVEKLHISQSTQSTAGAGNAPIRRDTWGYWSVTDLITTVDGFNPEGAGEFGTGSNMRVWGSD